MKPVSTKLLYFPSLYSTVFVCPPNRSAASYIYTSWWVRFNAHNAPIPAEPLPMIATFFLGSWGVNGAMMGKLLGLKVEKRAERIFTYFYLTSRLWSGELLVTASLLFWHAAVEVQFNFSASHVRRDWSENSAPNRDTMKAMEICIEQKVSRWILYEVVWHN